MLLVSTSRRAASAQEPTCFLYTVDEATWTVTSRCHLVEPRWREFDPNPRGGLRGAKGIAIGDDGVYVANASSVFCFDASWRPVRTLSHPSCSSIHDLLWDDGRLWVASCRNDMLWAFDGDGRIVQQIDVRASPSLREHLPVLTRRRKPIHSEGECLKDYRDPRSHSERIEDTTHLNSVARLADGSLLISLGLIWTFRTRLLLTVKDVLSRNGLWEYNVAINRKLRGLLGIRKHAHTEMVVPASKNTSAVVRIWADGKVTAPLILPGRHVPGHSLKVLDDGSVLLLDTSTGNVVQFNPESGEVLCEIAVEDAFLRGVVVLADGRIVVGSQSSLYLLDLASKSSQHLVTLTPKEDETVFAIAELPKGFSELPNSLGGSAAT